MFRFALAALVAVLSFQANAGSVDTNALSESISAIQFGDTNVPTSTRHRSHPDVVTPSVGTSNMVCRYGSSVGIGNLLFGGFGGATHQLDQGCEARADSAHFAALADLLDSMGREPDYMLDIAIRRMFMTREQWEQTWPDFWRP